MTAERYRMALERYNMTHKGAALFFGVTAQTSMKWANEMSNIPKILGMLLDCMDDLDLFPGPEYQRKIAKPGEGADEVTPLAVSWIFHENERRERERAAIEAAGNKGVIDPAKKGELSP
jgi:hypothetical protein